MKYIIKDFDLSKARNVKYYKRVPTGNPQIKYKYYYTKEEYLKTIKKKTT